ncbi:MAG: DUF1116 domain-containing protein [Clostridiales bacterium]|nr:DUF1116 domain-containing protein [Clostridiales bacterium]
MLNDKIKVINVGTDTFYDAVKDQGIEGVHLNWQPKAKVEISEEAKRIYEKMLEPSIKEKIDAANQKVIELFNNTDPYWIGMKPAKEVIPGVEDGMIIHSGPDIPWDEMCETQKQGGVNGIMYEGYAKTEEEAREMLRTGKIKFVSANDFHLVGPGSGITTPSMVVNVVEDRNTGARGFCPPFEGPNRGGLAGWGVFNESIREHLDMVRDVIAPAITKVLEANDGMAMKKIFIRGVEMGDELHSRQDATGLIATNELVKMLIDANLPQDAFKKCIDLLYGTVRFFHPLGMASAMALLESVRNVEYSTVVTTMVGNGVEYGIKVSGLGHKWNNAPSPKLTGEYVSANVNDDEVLPWIGDSCILEATGLGGFAAGAAPAVMRSLDKTMQDGVEQSLEMREIALIDNANYLIPALNYVGSPTAIDIRKVIDTGIEPVIHGGMISKTGKRLGAGTARVPYKCFEKAIIAFGEKYGI